MSKFFSLLIYNLLLPVGVVFMLPGALQKMRRRGGRWRDMAQRFGFLPADKRAAIAALPAGKNRLWLHAVSVGEVGIATKLITALLKAAPDMGVVVTTTTPTGHALAEEFAAKNLARVVVLYSPVDLPFVGSRLLDRVRPGQLVLVEAEVWPNLVSAAGRRRIPVSLVNARLSPRSERRFQKFGFFIKPVFAMLDQVLVQEPGDVARWTGLGVEQARIHHTGSIKFDPQGAAASESQVASLRALLETAGAGPERPVVLLASTHPGEEVLLGHVYLRLRQRFPELVLLIVPRHVERSADLQQDLQAIGLPSQRRSQITGPADCLIIDTTGELRAWQCLATIVVVGKSFLATGGQNPAEAVMAKKPVLFGPHMENFDALVGLLLAQRGAVQVADVGTLEARLATLLADPGQCAALGEAGFAALQAHDGATRKSVERLMGAS